MTSAPSAADISQDEDIPYTATGPRRFLSIEMRKQRTSNSAGHDQSTWSLVRGTVDTANYGTISFDASTRLSVTPSGTLGPTSAGVGSSFSLRQVNLPMGNGWTASQGLGVIQTTSAPSARQQASIFIPSRLILGASSQWSSEREGISFHSSTGTTGAFSSIGQGAFYSRGNHVATFGIQVDPVPGPEGASGSPSASGRPRPLGLSYSAAASFARGNLGLIDSGGQATLEPHDSGFLQTARWESRNSNIQGNLLLSTATCSACRALTPPTTRVGLWIDAAAQTGSQSSRWGLHRLDKDLSWMAAPMSNNTQGGYFRWSKTGLRDQIEAQASHIQATDSATGARATTQVGLSTRHRIDQTNSIGGTLQVTRGFSPNVQLAGYAETHRYWADLRWQASVVTDATSNISSRQLASDQAWSLPMGLRLSTSQALNITRKTLLSTDYANTSAIDLAITAGADLSDRASLDMSARSHTPTGPSRASEGQYFNLSASAQWRLGRDWSVNSVLAVSRTSNAIPVATALASPIPTLSNSYPAFAPPAAGFSTSREFWVNLRYEAQAGSLSSPIGNGATIGAGGADIEGIVYLDANSNSKLDASESRASGVTIILDGRYSTRTDAQGRFTFPLVAPGAHSLRLASDTLPLPWVAPDEDNRVDITPRERVHVEIGATALH